MELERQEKEEKLEREKREKEIERQKREEERLKFEMDEKKLIDEKEMSLLKKLEKDDKKSIDYISQVHDAKTLFDKGIDFENLIKNSTSFADNQKNLDDIDFHDMIDKQLNKRR